MQHPPSSAAEPAKSLDKADVSPSLKNVVSFLNRHPLLDEARVDNIARQTRRFSEYPLPEQPPMMAGNLHLPRASSFLTSAEIKTMKKKWQTAQHRQRYRVVGVNHVATPDFIKACHVLRYIREEWEFPAALVMGSRLSALSAGREVSKVEPVYIVPYYKVLKPRSKRITLPTLEDFGRVFSEYNR